jgi:hypothetical protein
MKLHAELRTSMTSATHDIYFSSFLYSDHIDAIAVDDVIVFSGHDGDGKNYNLILKQSELHELMDYLKNWPSTKG